MRTLQCKTCLVERDLVYFIRTEQNNKVYYARTKCKVCRSKSGRLNIKSLEKRKVKDDIKLSPEVFTYLEAIKRRKGLICELDFYLITHYYLNIFGYSETTYETIDEVKMMYDELISLT